MDQAEIIRYLQAGSNRSVCVDRRLLSNYPGFVRDVIIKAPSDVFVEINSFGHDEGGVIIKFRYANLSEIISAIERFLGKSISNWENVTKTDSYPSAPLSMNLSSSVISLKDDLRKRQLDLPAGWLDWEIAAGYWRDVAEGRVE